MKIIIINSGARPASASISEVNGEALVLAELLVQSGHQVTIGSSISKRDVLDPRFTWWDLTQEGAPEGDCLLWVNGKANFFGGADNPHEVLNYVLAHRFDGPILYLYTDTVLPLLDVRPNVASREWSKKYDMKELDLSGKDITLVCQGRRTEEVLAWHNSFAKDSQQLTKAVHFPLHLLFVRPEWRWGMPRDKKWDLIYGGGMRRGFRKRAIQSYFAAPDGLTSYIFGNIKDLNNPTAVMGPKVPWDLFISQMSEGFATCFIGDECFQQQQHITLRPYESIIAGCLTFCAPGLDEQRELFDEYFRVTGPTDFWLKVKHLKQNPSLAAELQAKQLDAAAHNIEHADFSAWLKQQLHT